MSEFVFSGGQDMMSVWMLVARNPAAWLNVLLPSEVRSCLARQPWANLILLQKSRSYRVHPMYMGVYTYLTYLHTCASTLACMYIYIYILICCLSTHIYIYIYRYTSTCIYIYMYAMYTRICVALIQEF